ncbi:sulfatase [Arenibacter sp. S6351L]|uniref:sulfatase n=1 Tax=Arenibacter sp. S6351L TaxID=2926407 RepID=UPI001FF4D86A|nr:sulfatase [Arenibacter sp. S6351L]MCK0134930.1 sulfatase [Arenibacter sp. S6351L]
MTPRKTSYILLVGVLLLLSSCMGVSPAKKEKQKSPNIIFILTDDQGWTQTSHRADPNIPESKSDYYETPNMDLLAESGVLFTEGYAPNPICSPSRNSLMFGQNGARHIYNKDADWYKKTTNWLTIPRAIKKANPAYRTAHFGKWHIAMEPKDAGFDYNDGMTSNSGGEIFGDGFLNIKEYTKAADKYMKDNKEENPSNAKRAGKPSGHWDDKNAKDIFGITKRAKDFMKESVAEGKPFYVQLSHYAAHLSLVSQKETYEYFKNKKPGERHTNPEFGAMLKDLDTGVGMIMDFVKEMEIEDNTYIFLMGDNGGRLSLNQIAVIDENKELVNAYYSTQHNRNLPLRDGKHSFYEGGIRVPFMAVGPGIKANRVSRTPVTGLDFLPTFTELAGGNVEMTDAIDGGNMVPLLLNEKIEKVERNSEYLIFHQGSHRKPRSAIRKGDFKLIKYWSKETKYKNTPKVELFNIKEDLGETTNIIEKYPEIARELETELNKFLTKTNAETGIRDIEGAYYRLMDDLELSSDDDE